MSWHYFPWQLLLRGFRTVLLENLHETLTAVANLMAGGSASISGI